MNDIIFLIYKKRGIAMDRLIETLSETLLWQSIFDYVERTAQVSEILKDIGYIEHTVFNEVKKAEIFESEEFVIESIQAQNNKYYISYRMPTILMFYDSNEQILRVTTNIVGCCCIADKDHFNWNQHDFDSMNRLELLSHKDLVEVIECRYEDVECDDLRVI